MRTACHSSDYFSQQDGYPYRTELGCKIYIARENLEKKLGRVLKDVERTIHICGNSWCINPDHLEVGTQADIIANTVSLRQHSYGESRPTSKLTDETVREIHTRLESTDVTVTALASEYGVNKSQISRIKNGRTWKHVPERGDYE